MIYTENEQIINRRTPVRIQRWTMEGMRGLDTVPLEDVLTCLRSNIKGTEDVLLIWPWSNPGLL